MSEEKVEKKIEGPSKEVGRSSVWSKVYIIFGLVAVLGWVIVFGLGLLVNSKVYRDSLLAHFNFSDFFASIFTYTPTNIALLSIVAAFAGGSASKLVVTGVLHAPAIATPGNKPEEVKDDSHIYMNESPFSSMLRGLVVYFAYLGGVFIASPDPFGSPTPQQYAQSAGVVSFLAFVVGYDPTVFRSLISLADKIKTKS
jgi:hypothetical protein